MARIKIEELPVMEDMGEKELKGIFGGMRNSLRRRITSRHRSLVRKRVGRTLGRPVKGVGATGLYGGGGTGLHGGTGLYGASGLYGADGASGLYGG